MSKRSFGIVAALTVGAAMLAAPANAQQRVVVERGNPVKAGTLSCDVSAGIGLIIGSRKDVKCIFTPSRPGPKEVYVGSISKFGIDIGATAGGEMVWSVYMPTNGQYAALAGDYNGASAEATVGAGLGANVLVGGSSRTVSLQPVSVQGQAGLNLAAGVAGLHLRPVQ